MASEHAAFLDAVLGQLRFAPHGNGDLCGTLHVNTTIVGRERVHRQSLDNAAGFRAANARAPTVELEGSCDVHSHCKG